MRVIAGVALWLMASSAFAVPVTYVFSGYVNQSSFGGPTEGPYAGLVPPDLGVEVGMTFNGLLNYDPDALNCNPISETSRECGNWETENFWMVSLGSIVLTSTGPYVYVADDVVSFQQGGKFLPAIFDGWSLLAQSDTYLYLTDSSASGSLLDYTTAPIDLEQFQQGYWLENAFIRPESWTVDGIRWDIGGTITEFHRVPEPATLGLLGLGLLGLVQRRRKTNASH